MARKPSRPSLLDLEPRDGPPERLRLNWMLWQKPRYERIVREFQAEYGESPVFRKRHVTRQVDLYLTHPENALAVYLQDGSLVSDSSLHRLAWGTDMASLAAERRRHISPQVQALLDGEISARQWSREIMQRLFFHPEREQELARLLQESGLAYCLEKEWHRGVIRVFGAPEEISSIFRRGAELGLIFMEKR